jgi:hypothetical protein
MARKPKKQSTTTDEGDDQKVSLARFLSQKAVFAQYDFWIVGDAPLIVHSWSEKAKREMLQTQTKATKPGRDPRDPQAEFLASLYQIDENTFGFPATAVKKAILSAAHKDKGIPRDTVMRSLWITAPFVRVRAAHPGAICDLPLVRLWGGKPQMREDMVRIGAGLRKTASLTWRGQFPVWAIKVNGRYNASVINPDVIASLIDDGGRSCGIGDWRNEKSGMFGSFHLASAEEQRQWELFAKGKGPLPKPPTEFLQAAE